MGVPAYATSRRRALRRLDLRRMFLHDVLLKVAALAIAFIAFVAVAESNQQATATFQVPVERPEVPAGYVLRGTLGDVTVKLRGPQSQLTKIAQADVRPMPDLAQADLSRNDVQNVALRVAFADPAIIATTEPPSVALRIEKIISRSLPVQVRFANDAPRGFQPGPPSLSTTEVRISGAQSLVASVVAVFATLRFGDAPVDITSSAEAVPVDAAGIAVEGVQSDPAALLVSVPLLSTTSTRTVPVLWQIRGSVAQGYWISRVTTDPVAVQVQGTPEKIRSLDRVDTAPVDVSGISANTSYRVAVLLPEGVSLLQPTDATVGVTVIPLTGTRPFPLVAVQVVGAGPGLAGDTDPTTVSVVVSGPISVLATLGIDSVTATVDASGKGQGSAPADVVLKLPPGVTAVSVQPSRVTLTMRSR